MVVGALPMNAQMLVPHRAPMLLVDRLESVDGETAVISACLGADCVLVDEKGQLDAVIYAELVAQAYAAFKGYQLALSGEPAREGFLVGIRKMRIVGVAHAGDELFVQVTTVGSLDGFAVVDGLVQRDSELIAEVRLKLYVPGEGGPEL